MELRSSGLVLTQARLAVQTSVNLNRRRGSGGTTKTPSSGLSPESQAAGVSVESQLSLSPRLESLTWNLKFREPD
jgi:hypothetical protein